MIPSRRITASIRFLGLGGLAACADSTGVGGGTRPVSLSFSTVAALPSGAARSRMSVGGMADALVLTRAQVVISRMELERVGVTCDDSRGRGDDDCPELKSGPMLVTLPLDGRTRTELTVSIPAGSYDRFEAKVRPVAAEDSRRDRDADAADFLAAHPQFHGVTVRVEGTYNGTPFVFTTAVETGIELDLVPALTVDGAANNITVLVDVPSWFRSGTASIDPASANAGGVNKRAVDERIKRSFKVFEDDDHDGRDH